MELKETTLAYNVVVLSEEQKSTDIDWNQLVTSDAQAVLIRLSHGITQDSEASVHIANAKNAGLQVHGYHEYEGVDGEVPFSLNNGVDLGLAQGAYMFLKNAPTDSVLGFANNWLSAGWKIGVNAVQEDYYQWISNSDEPEIYDLWQFDDAHAFDSSGKLLLDPVDPNPTIDSSTPSSPKAGAYVGFGNDTSGLLGGESLGYSTDGINFYAAITPFGIIFRENDAERMSKLLVNKLKLQSPNGTVFNLSINDDGVLSAVKEGDDSGTDGTN
ncbi:hypothetical protein FEZ51_08600 [Pediococcus stilesii]|uniref:Uncharacterized protein n=1 Tax=Pediococcus stilesii TaxID=331679 RepID=A0A5R9BSJ9_9LACO|nr:hypothetical protein [Pediococcus stilesii]TLQ03654.1 hypothetical protein FEZ51_08600 [Pediococcus stilesii]